MPDGNGSTATEADISDHDDEGVHVPTVRAKRSAVVLGHLESAVLGVVAGAAHPLTVGQVQAQLPGSPAYTTVMSTLARLADKGALSRALDGRAYRYELAAPAGSIDDALTARQMRRLMDQGGHRDAVLARFVAELDPDEGRFLAELLTGSRNADRPVR